MRVWRLSLVGTVILGLLGGTGAAAVAQDDQMVTPATDFTYSTGTFQQVDMQEGVYFEIGDGGMAERGSQRSAGLVSQVSHPSRNHLSPLV